MRANNLQTVRRWFEAWSRRDLRALLEIYDDDVTILPLTGTRVESGGYRGHDGAREYFDEVDAVWAQMLPYANDLREAGDTVVAIGGCRVRGRESGAEADTPMAWVIRLRDGKIVSTRAYPDPEGALSATGLEDR
jgi:ketosteroid isomerase-like protein